MENKVNSHKKYSNSDLKKIRKRAAEIWKGKCQSLNTALDDWLEAEQELKSQSAISHKKPDQYTEAEVLKIKKRAQAIRDEKVKSLRTAFDDWIEAEKELKGELKGHVKPSDLFDLWFSKASSKVAALLREDTVIPSSTLDDVLGRQYIELMAECMT